MNPFEAMMHDAMKGNSEEGSLGETIKRIMGNLGNDESAVGSPGEFIKRMVEGHMFVIKKRKKPETIATDAEIHGKQSEIDFLVNSISEFYSDVTELEENLETAKNVNDNLQGQLQDKINETDMLRSARIDFLHNISHLESRTEDLENAEAAAISETARLQDIIDKAMTAVNTMIGEADDESDNNPVQSCLVEVKKILADSLDDIPEEEVTDSDQIQEDESGVLEADDDEQVEEEMASAANM